MKTFFYTLLFLPILSVAMNENVGKENVGYEETTIIVSGKKYPMIILGADMKKKDVQPSLRPALSQKSTRLRRCLIKDNKAAEELLFDACDSGELFWVKNAIEKKKSRINIKDPEYRDTPLHVAVSGGHIHIVRYLLTQKPDVNVTDENGRTPLFLAALRGDSVIVSTLCGTEADVNKADDWKETPLHVAVRKKFVSCVGVLLAHKAKVNMQDEDGDTPLHIALSNYQANDKKSKEIIRSLLSHGANLHTQKNNKGKTAFTGAPKQAKLFLKMYERQKQGKNK